MIPLFCCYAHLTLPGRRFYVLILRGHCCIPTYLSFCIASPPRTHYFCVVHRLGGLFTCSWTCNTHHDLLAISMLLLYIRGVRTRHACTGAPESGIIALSRLSAKVAQTSRLRLPCTANLFSRFLCQHRFLFFHHVLAQLTKFFAAFSLFTSYISNS